METIVICLHGRNRMVSFKDLYAIETTVRIIEGTHFRIYI